MESKETNPIERAKPTLWGIWCTLFTIFLILFVFGGSLCISEVREEMQETINSQQQDIDQYKEIADQYKKELVKYKNLYDSIENAEDELSSVNSNIEDKEKEIKDLEDKKNTLHGELNDIEEQIDISKKELAGLNTKINSQKQIVTKTTTVPSNLSEYSYVMTFGGGTDVTPELVQYTIDLCNKYDIDPHLVFAIIIHESGGQSDAYNSRSGAAGLGQFTYSGGKATYENVMHLGVYNHSTHPYDPKLNITMMVELLNYYKKMYNGSVVDMIGAYAGYRSLDYSANLYSKLCDIAGTMIGV